VPKSRLLPTRYTSSNGRAPALQGKLAPAFTGFTLNQQRVTHADYLGQESSSVSLDLLPHCRNVLPDIERVGAHCWVAARRSPASFIADAEKTRASCQECGLTLPVLLSPRRKPPSARITIAQQRAAFVAVNNEGIVTGEGMVHRQDEAWRAFVHLWQAYPILAKSAALYRR